MKNLLLEKLHNRKIGTKLLIEAGGLNNSKEVKSSSVILPWWSSSQQIK